jgi:recombination protein RecR
VKRTSVRPHRPIVHDAANRSLVKTHDANGSAVDSRLEQAKVRLMRAKILATNPTVHGEATALLITRMFKNSNIRITRIAMGVPMGGDLRYVDKMTISKSLEFRRGM